MTITTDAIPADWQRAMERARRDSTRTLRLNVNGQTLHLATSKSSPGMRHAVAITRGKVSGCDCEGAARGYVCKHQGAWAARLLRERKIRVRASAASQGVAA